MTHPSCGCSFRPRNTLGKPELCLKDQEPELAEISPATGYKTARAAWPEIKILEKLKNL